MVFQDFHVCFFLISAYFHGWNASFRELCLHLVWTKSLVHRPFYPFTRWWIRFNKMWTVAPPSPSGTALKTVVAAMSSSELGGGHVGGQGRVLGWEIHTLQSPPSLKLQTRHLKHQGWLVPKWVFWCWAVNSAGSCWSVSFWEYLPWRLLEAIHFGIIWWRSPYRGGIWSYLTGFGCRAAWESSPSEFCHKNLSWRLLELQTVMCWIYVKKFNTSG